MNNYICISVFPFMKFILINYLSLIKAHINLPRLIMFLFFVCVYLYLFRSMKDRKYLLTSTTKTLQFTYFVTISQKTRP